MTSLTHSPQSGLPLRRRIFKGLLWFVVLTVMALGFIGYLMPGISLNWETITTMCGF